MFIHDIFFFKRHALFRKAEQNKNTHNHQARTQPQKAEGTTPSRSLKIEGKRRKPQQPQNQNNAKTTKQQRKTRHPTD